MADDLEAGVGGHLPWPSARGSNHASASACWLQELWLVRSPSYSQTFSTVRVVQKHVMRRFSLRLPEGGLPMLTRGWRRHPGWGCPRLELPIAFEVTGARDRSTGSFPARNILRKASHLEPLAATVPGLR